MAEQNTPETLTAPRKRWHKTLWVILTALAVALVAVAQFLPTATHTMLVERGADAMHTLIKLLIGDMVDLFGGAWMLFFLYACVIAVPTWLAWLAACERREDGKKALLPALYVGGLLSVVGSLLPMIRGSEFDLLALLFMLCGAVGMAVVIFVCITVPREIVDYVVFGVLATVVNLVAFNLCDLWFAMPTWLSTSIAWLAAVIFAYFTNKTFVFHSKTHGFKELAREAGMFFGARALTYLIDLGGMLLLVDVLHVSGGISKILCNIIVLVLNYVFSKLFIFNKGTADKAE